MTDPASSIAERRLAAQGLVGRPFDAASGAVRHLLAVQSQDYPGAKWALAQRLPATATEAEVDRLFDEGAILRTHVLRPTWHFVDPADIRWLLTLTAPRVHQANGFQYRQLELDAGTRARSRNVINRVLAGGRSMSRHELARALSEAGVLGSSLRLGYLIIDAELEGVVCSGPRQGKRHTYALLEERVPAAPPRERDEALAELARRFVEGHGPAQSADLAWWSGLTVAEARRALDLATPPLTRESAGDRTFWFAGSEPGHQPGPAAPAVHLLPNYDELLVAFRDRGDALDAALPPAERVPQVILSHVIVRNGLVVGSWRRADRGLTTILEVRLSIALDSAEREALDAQVGRLSRFLGRSVEVVGLD